MRAVPLHDPLRPPGPPPVTYHPLSLLCYAKRLQTDPVARICQRFDTYGDLYCAPFLGRDTYVLRHPAHIQEVLVTQAHRFEKPSEGPMARQLRRVLGEGLLNSNGELWRRHRRLIQPAFRRESLQVYAPLIVGHARQLMEGLHDGQQINTAQTMMQLTLRIVSKALFALELEAEVERFGHAMQTFRAAFSRLGAALPDWLPSPAQRHALAALAEVDAVVYSLIDSPQARRGHNLLSSLLAAVDAGDPSLRLDRKQLRDELVTLFVAGHETTALALTWTWHLLAQHPEGEAQLHAELDRVLGGREPAVTDLPQLVYAEQVLSEAMRLYPPAYVLLRVCVEEARIGGYRIPQGSDVIVRVYHTHHDARWFPDPERFDPERFARGRRRTIPPCAYLPFGAGTRLCVGKNFAMLEALLILACVAQRFSLQSLPGSRVDLDMALTLAPKRGLPMRLRARPRRSDFTYPSHAGT